MKKVEVFIFDIYTPKKAKNLGSNQVKKTQARYLKNLKSWNHPSFFKHRTWLYQTNMFSRMIISDNFSSFKEKNIWI